MYRKITDFLKIWNQETESTLKIFGSLTDESLNQKVSLEGRDLGMLAWHITFTLGEMMSRAGLELEMPDEHADRPSSVNEIVEIYRSESQKIGKLVQLSWKDEDLDEKVNMYGEEWKKGVILQVLVHHQIHHRAQMTVLMRQAGLRVPGIYGPSREEWAALGMPAMK